MLNAEDIDSPFARPNAHVIKRPPLFPVTELNHSIHSLDTLFKDEGVPANGNHLNNVVLR
jgi:hypothetical protein